MKIKVTLLFGLLFAHSVIHPLYADPNLNKDGVYLEEFDLEENTYGRCPSGVKPVDKVDKLADKSKGITVKNTKVSKQLLKVGGNMGMHSFLSSQDEEYRASSNVAACLNFKANLPEICFRENATAKLRIDFKKNEPCLGEALVTIAKTFRIGYGRSIFGYKRANPALPISIDARVLHMQFKSVMGCFQFACAIEGPIGLQLGFFDKQYVDNADNQLSKDLNPSQYKANQLDDIKDEKRPFKVQGNIPTFGLSLGGVSDQFNIGATGLVRITDYTHATDPKNEKVSSDFHFAYAADLGMQWKVVPKKFTITGQVSYVSGLGDYLSGLAKIQNDEKRKEMVAVYYTDKSKNLLYTIDAYGLGGTLEMYVTPKVTFSVAGAYLQIIEDESARSASSFKAQWSGYSSIAYKFSKYFSIFSGYGVKKEQKVNVDKNKSIENKVFGGMKFSC